MKMERLSGILAHPTSFPSLYGIGDFGPGAYDFIDFLKKAKQRLWQILPLNPTGFGDSPYQSFSAYGINELLISPEMPPMCGLLTPEERRAPEDFCDGDRARKVDFNAVLSYKDGLYRKAFGRLKGRIAGRCEDWLSEYALFTAIRRRFGVGWNKWPIGLARHEKSSIKEMRETLAEEIEYVKFLQYVALTQWKNLKKYANKNDVLVIGDLPIFVAFDSSDVWADRELFQMNGMSPGSVAGVPPDYFSKTGQLWGNPLYDWRYHETTGFEWWISRLRHAFVLADIIRIDHFRGFESYWSVPFGAESATKGRWIKGPGDKLFTIVKKIFGDAPIIAEDLGIITPEVTELRKRFGFPGMKILQFGMEGGINNPYLPHNYEDSACVAYTGTHDNDTTKGWYDTASEPTKDYFRRYMNVDGKNPAWDLIRLIFASTAKWVIAPIQDVLSLGGEDRMNLPGTAEGNWRFRYTSDMLTDSHAAGLRYLSELFGRNLEKGAK